MSHVKQFNDGDFKETVLKSDKPVLVDFWATWCGPCHMLAPIINDIADDFKDTVTVGKMDVDDNPVTASGFDIRSIPTLILFKDGKEATRLTGVRSKAEIADTIKYYIQAEAVA
jgi:thioredoxin 1